MWWFGRRVEGAAAAVFALFAVASSPAAAQVSEGLFGPLPILTGGDVNDQSLAQTNLLYESPGLRAGSFTIRPNLTESVGYNSNVESLPNGRGSSLVLTNASLVAASDWKRDSVFVNLNVTDNHYLELPQQNYTQWIASAGGTYVVGHDLVTATYTHSNLFQVPGAINNAIGNLTVSQPAAFRLDTARLGYTISGRGPLSFTPELIVSHFDFDPLIVSGQTVSQTFRNRVTVQEGLTTRYEFSPNRAALLVVRGTQQFYNVGTVTLPRRNSEGVEVLGGIDYPQPGSNVRLRVLAGVQTRNFNSKVYTNQVSPIIEGTAVWTPTRLTTLTLNARRDIEDAQDESIAAFTLTTVRLTANHELRRDVQLNGFAELQQADYEAAQLNLPNVANTRQAGTSQVIYNVGAGATWLLNRDVRAGFSYEFTERPGYAGTVGNHSSTSLFNLVLRL